MPTHLSRAVFVCCLAVMFSGCSRNADDDIVDGTTSAATAPDSAATSVAVLDTTDAWRPEERESLPSNRIYYNLTDYGWYARGEPLQHDGASYVPAGMPVAASVADMTKAGEFEGVEFYTRSDGGEPRLYVPVFEGYWLAFRQETIRTAATPADTIR